MAQSTLLSLPFEIRQPILLYALQDEHAKLDLRCGKDKKSERTKRCYLMYHDREITSNFALPCTCRQLHHEVQDIFENQISVHLHIRQRNLCRPRHSGLHNISGTLVTRIRRFVIHDRDNWASVWWRFLADFPCKDLICLQTQSDIPASVFTLDHRKSFRAVEFEDMATRNRVEKHAMAYFKNKKARVWSLKERRVPLEVKKQIGSWQEPLPDAPAESQFAWVG